jgi:hypothetical protein
MIEKRFDVDAHLLGQQKLLLVELVGHLVPKRLVKGLSDYDDEGEDEKERKNDDERRKDFAVFQVAKHTEHALIYCQHTIDVKGLDCQLRNQMPGAQ